MNENVRWRQKDKLIPIVSFCLLLQMLISYPLWIGANRYYPKISVIDDISLVFVDSIGYLLFSMALICLLIFIIGKVNKYFIFLFFLVLALFVLNDINRLQVWMYQLSVVLFVLFYSTSDSKKSTIIALRIIMIGIYFWSGIQKINIYYVEDIFPWFVEPYGLKSFVDSNPLIAYVTALIETLIGLGLVFRKTSRIASILAISMHLLILIVLSPLGHNWNHVVWPWNVCLIALVYYLFYKNKEVVSIISLTNFRSFSFTPFIVLLFGIMPIFNFFGFWDEQLSFKMYSGMSPEGVIYFNQTEEGCIPLFLEDHFIDISHNSKTTRIVLDDWIIEELYVPPYKSRKRIVQAAQKLCRCFENPELAGLELLEVNRWDKKKDSWTTFPCVDLLESVTEND